MRTCKYIGESRPAQTPKATSRGQLDVVVKSMQIMQDTMAHLRFSDPSPDMTVQIPVMRAASSSSGRAEELKALGRGRTALAFALD